MTLIRTHIQQAKIARICRRCATEFLPWRGSPGIFCSRKCVREQMARPASVCKVCKIIFAPSHHSSGKYCSQSCFHSVPPRTTPMADRFWKYVNKNGPVIRPELDACWLWMGSDDGGDGYGRFHASRRRRIGSHKASWLIHFGEVRAGLQVCHKCDNPPCVNPSHLFLGTNSDNQLDRIAKGRWRSWDHKGSLHPMAKMDESRVIEMRRLKASLSADELALRYGIAKSTVYSILSGERWSHV